MARSREWRLLLLALVMSDSLALASAFGTAYHLRLSGGVLPYGSTFNPQLYLAAVLGVLVIWILLFAFYHLYDPAYLLGGPQEYANVLNACTYGLAVVMAISFLERGSELSRGWLLLGWGLAIVFVGAARFIIRRIVYRLRRRGLFISRALVVGASDQGMAIADQLYPPTKHGVQVVGFVDDYLPVGTRVTGNLRVLGDAMSLSALAKEVQASEVIIIPSAISWESLQNLVNANTASEDSFEAKLSPGFYDILATGVRVSRKGYIPLLTLDKVRITGIDALLKGLLDLVLGVVLTLLLSPAMAAAIIRRKMTSSVPVFQRHTFLGRRARPFEAITFRRPTAGALKLPPSRWQRLVDTVRFYEWPLLFSLLRRQMSLVGPRPIAPGDLTTLEKWSANLLTVRPGLTGPWLVGCNDYSSLEDAVRQDIYYIRNYTIWLDLQILFQMVRGIVQGIYNVLLATNQPQVISVGTQPDGPMANRDSSTGEARAFSRYGTSTGGQDG